MNTERPDWDFSHGWKSDQWDTIAFAIKHSDPQDFYMCSYWPGIYMAPNMTYTKNKMNETQAHGSSSSRMLKSNEPCFTISGLYVLVPETQGKNTFEIQKM